MKKINKKRKQTFGWWGALSAIKGGAWLTSTQMKLSTKKHTTLYSNDGTQIQCVEEQIKAWIDKTGTQLSSHAEDDIYSCLQRWASQPFSGWLLSKFSQS